MKLSKLLVPLGIGLLLIALAAATVIEAATGASHVYGTWWFDALWVLFGVGMACALPKLWWRSKVLVMLHVAMLTILCGAALTHWTATDGRVHLRQGIPATVGDGLLLRLDSFEVRCYPGTPTPADYVSHLSVTSHLTPHTSTLSMNRPLTVDGYRLFQSGYDTDLHGSTLLWSHDPWGMPVTYTGYALLVLSLVLWLFGRSVVRLFGCLVIGLAVCSCSAYSEETSHFTPAISRHQADSLERVQVLYNGRPAPMGTVAHDFMLKVHGATSYGNLDAMQVVGSWLLCPEEWSREPLIRIKGKWLRRELSLDEYASLSSLFDEAGEYRLAPLYAKVQDNPKAAKAVRELDEQVGIVLMLEQGTLFERMDDPQLSPARVEAELLYNRLPATLILFIACFVCALLSLWRRMSPLHPFMLSLILLLQASYYALRWYVAGHLPLANGFETMLFLALVVLAIGLCTRQYAASLLVAGCTLLVAHIGQMSPQITPLVPVLNSPWLSSHVSCIMTAYALAALQTVRSVQALLRPTLHTSHFTLLRPLVALMAVGIVLGAVWANESWGRYWAWDPKEVWALITLIVYALPLHPSLLPLRTARAYNIYIVCAFATVLMTYFGVNYVLGGLHSYA